MLGRVEGETASKVVDAVAVRFRGIDVFEPEVVVVIISGLVIGGIVKGVVVVRVGEVAWEGVRGRCRGRWGKAAQG